MPSLIVCPACARDVADNAPRCPHCGTPWPGRAHGAAPEPAAPATPPRRLGCLGWAVVVVLGLWLLSLLAPGSITPRPPRSENAERFAAGESDAASGAWSVQRGRSEIDDTPSVVLTLEADDPTESTIGLDTRATLVVRCQENTTSAYVEWDNYLGMDETRVEYRLDGGEARTQPWILSNQGTGAGLWNGRTAIPFLNRIENGSRLVMRVTPYRAATQTAGFTLDGLAGLLPEVKQACGWAT